MWRRLLSGLAISILTLRATGDRLAPRNHLPNPVEIEGTHFLPQSNPVAAARAVSRFIVGAGVNSD